MKSADLHRSLPLLFGELAYGAPDDGAFILNPRDAGLLASLDRLSAEAASQVSKGGASIAAHVNHVRYGLSLMNRWAAGDDPFADARWAESWQRSRVSEEEWRELRRELRATVDEWQETLQSSREVSGKELDGVIGSIIHLAYHLGAIRQIDPSIRGPKARD
jgi:hypothetical protein